MNKTNAVILNTQAEIVAYLRRVSPECWQAEYPRSGQVLSFGTLAEVREFAGLRQQRVISGASVTAYAQR